MEKDDSKLRFFVGNGYACFKKNWSTTSGGKGGASVPTKENTVFFDQWSGDVILGYPWWYLVFYYLTHFKKPEPWQFKSIYQYSHGETRVIEPGTITWRDGEVSIKNPVYKHAFVITLKSDLIISGNLSLGHTILFH